MQHACLLRFLLARRPKRAIMLCLLDVLSSSMHLRNQQRHHTRSHLHEFHCKEHKNTAIIGLLSRRVWSTDWMAVVPITTLDVPLQCVYYSIWNDVSKVVTLGGPLLTAQLNNPSHAACIAQDGETSATDERHAIMTVVIVPRAPGGDQELPGAGNLYEYEQDSLRIVATHECYWVEGPMAGEGLWDLLWFIDSSTLRPNSEATIALPT
eukprot:scaffold161972_cov20-Prasinocladus_malaysianus.AAC.2